jgi:hypothetical protein
VAAANAATVAYMGKQISYEAKVKSAPLSSFLEDEE